MEPVRLDADQQEDVPPGTAAGQESAPARPPPARLAALGPDARAAAMASLQHGVGNAQVARLLQRNSTTPLFTFKSDETLIKDATGDDPLADRIQAIKEISDYKKAGAHRIAMITTLTQDPEPNWRTRRGLLHLWDSFDEPELEAVVTQNRALWDKSVSLAPDHMADVKAVKTLVESFPKEVRLAAGDYLSDNLKLVRNQQTELGLLTYEEDDLKPKPMDEDTTKRMTEMRKAAGSLQQLQKAQEAARDTHVGWDQLLVTMGGPPTYTYIEAKFNPLKPPSTEEQPPNYPLLGVHAPYATIKARYDAATKEIEGLLTTFPELYAISREGSSELTGQFAKIEDPAKARAALGRALDLLVKDIKGAQDKVKEGGSLDPLDLTPIHGRLIGGDKPRDVVTDWSKPLASLAAATAAKNHKFETAMKEIGVELAAQAMFLVAPFTGGASLFVALAALGMQAAKTGGAEIKAEAITQASKTSVKPGTEIVPAGAAEQAQAAARAEEVALALAAICVGGEVVGGAIKGMRVNEPATPPAAGEVKSVTAASSPPSPPVKVNPAEPMVLESTAESSARLQEQIGSRPGEIEPPPAAAEPMVIESNKAPQGETHGTPSETDLPLESPMETAERLGKDWQPPSGKKKVVNVRLRRTRVDPRWKLTREDEMTYVTFGVTGKRAPQKGVPYSVRAGWNSYYRFTPPQGGGVVEIGPRRYVYDAAGNPIEASTTDMSLGARERGQYQGGGPDYRPGDDYGHLLGIDFGHIDAQVGRAGGGPQASGVNRLGAGGGGDWYLAEREAARQAWGLKGNGEPMRVVAQAKDYVGTRAGSNRIYVESDGRIVYDSGWIANP